MPSSYEPSFHRVPRAPRGARLLLTLTCAGVAVAGCRVRGEPGANGIETGAIGSDSTARDTAHRDTTHAADPAQPAPGTLKVSNVMIGRQLGPENRMSEPTLRFAPTDTMFIAIATEGTPDSAALRATWTFPTGKVQDSALQVVHPKGAAHSELHATPPKKGWPVGSYLIRVYANGDSVDAKTVAVQK